jgi:hypothetical protein
MQTRQQTGGRKYFRLVGDKDCFDDPVNRACKLGEDVAASDEILVTKDAMSTVTSELDFQLREVNGSISGITIPHIQLSIGWNKQKIAPHTGEKRLNPHRGCSMNWSK